MHTPIKIKIKITSTKNFVYHLSKFALISSIKYFEYPFASKILSKLPSKQFLKITKQIEKALFGHHSFHKIKRTHNLLLNNML